MTVFLIPGYSNSSLEIKLKNSENPTKSRGHCVDRCYRKKWEKTLCSLKLMDIAHQLNFTTSDKTTVF